MQSATKPPPRLSQQEQAPNTRFKPVIGGEQVGRESTVDSSDSVTSSRLDRLLHRVRRLVRPAARKLFKLLCGLLLADTLVNALLCKISPLLDRLQLEQLHRPLQAADDPVAGAAIGDTAERRSSYLLSSGSGKRRSQLEPPSFTFQPSFVNVATDRPLRLKIEELRAAESRVRELSEATRAVFTVRPVVEELSPLPRLVLFHLTGKGHRVFVGRISAHERRPSSRYLF